MLLSNCLFLPTQQYFGLAPKGIKALLRWWLCASASSEAAEPVGNFKVTLIMISKILT